jgi:hypothetical protein
MTFDLARFTIADTLSCSAHLRTALDGQASVEEIGRQTCSFFFDSFRDAKGAPAFALARLYITHPYARLPLEEQRFARNLLPGPVSRWPDLMATRGERDSWNDREASHGHRAIPLPSASIVEQAPMIAQLFLQMGVELSTVVKAEATLFADLTKKTYNVFHVAKALGSPYIPAQAEFVKPFGIESVVGFGGAVPWGEHFAVVLFSRVPVTGAVASRFKSFALDIKSRMLKLNSEEVFSAGKDMPATSAPAAARTLSMSSVESSVTQVAPSASGFRQFRDSRGVEWNVWAIMPAATALLKGRSERWHAGWLLFESSSESRRLTPIPPDWLNDNERKLEELCGQAERKRAGSRAL